MVKRQVFSQNPLPKLFTLLSTYEILRTFVAYLPKEIFCNLINPNNLFILKCFAVDEFGG